MPLQVHVVLLAQRTRHFSCSLHFLGSLPLFPPFFLFYTLIHYQPSKLSTVLPVQSDGCWGGGWCRFFLAGGACGWFASRAGS